MGATHSHATAGNSKCSAAKEVAEATEAFKPYLTISDVYKRSCDSLNK